MKLITTNKRKKPADMGDTEREHAYAGIPKEGDRRVKWYAPYVLNPDTNFRTANHISYNFRTDALGRNWLQGYFQVGDVDLDEDRWKPAYWDADHAIFTPGPGIDNQDGSFGAKPRPIALIDDGDGVHITIGDPTPYAGLYLTAQSNSLSSLEEAGGMILAWDGLEDPISNQGDTGLWYRRTVTDTPLDNGTEFGWGFDGSFAAGVDLRAFDVTATPPFPKYANAPLRDADTDKPAGFGHFWQGVPRVIFYHGARWYGLWQGYVYDRGGDPIDDGTATYHRYCANALARCNEGEAPTNIPAWANVMAVFAPFAVDAPWDALGGADKEHSLNHFWVEQQSDNTFFTASPINLPTDDIPDEAISNDTCVWCLDASNVLHESLSWFDSDSTGGPLVQYSGRIYFPMLSVSEGKLYIWRLDSAPASWSIIAEIALTLNDEVEGSRPYIATAWGHNGRLSVVYGRRPTIWNDKPIPDGSHEDTAWSMRTWTIGSTFWRTLSGSMPAGFDADDGGLYPRLFPLTLTDIGGGGGGGTGPCDDTYFVHGTPSISKAVFATHMSGSPLLGEHTSDWFYDACVAADVNPAFALAVWTKESVVGTAPGEADGAYNVGNIRREYWGRQIGSWPTDCCGTFGAYANWTDGALDFMDLCNLSIYATDSISEFISTYAPSSENNTTLYISQTCQRMSDWAAESGL